MITIHLDNAKEEQLRSLAERLHQNPEEIVRRIVEAHLDSASWPRDNEADWAEASIALAAELMGEEDWNEDNGGTHGPG